MLLIYPKHNYLAVSLALMANPNRTKIVTFVGNFSGKTLISMNLSKYGQQYTASNREAFRPYYFDVTYVDPFRRDAAATLEGILRAGDVALVWFEAIQGMDCRPLPEEIFAVVRRFKAEAGYLVGVDEVLTGVWRTGTDFLAQKAWLVDADITALAKPLSDATLPMAVALASNAVYERASASNSSLVSTLGEHYRNALSAHIAVNALESVGTEGEQARRLRNQKVLGDGLAAVAASSTLFDAATGRGGHMRLVMNSRWFPYRKHSLV